MRGRDGEETGYILKRFGTELATLVNPAGKGECLSTRTSRVRSGRIRDASATQRSSATARLRLQSENPLDRARDSGDARAGSTARRRRLADLIERGSR